MTFFLRDGATPEIEARGVNTPLPSFWGGVSAAFQKEQLEGNANMRRQRVEYDERRRLASEALPKLDDSALSEWQDRQRGVPGYDPASARSTILLDPAGIDYVLSKSGVADDEAIQKTVNERLQKEDVDARQTLDAMGSGRMIAEFIGGAAGMMTDVRQIPLLVAGGGTGSFARIMGREAMLNVAGEAATLPSRFDMAERLNIPDPDVATTLAMAAIGGAAFGGAVEGLSRGITYWRGTRGVQSERVAGYDVEMNVDLAEDAIADGARVFDVVPERIREEPKLPDSAPAATDVAAARLSDGSAMTTRSIEAPASEAPSASPPRSAEQALSDLFDQPGARGGVGERQMDIEDLIAERAADAAPDVPVQSRVSADDDPLPRSLERGLQAEAGGNRPLINHLKNRYGGVSPDSRLGQELKAMGITSRDVPGLFRNQGRGGFDNIPAAEEPHLAAVIGEDGNGYIREDGIAAAIADEIGGRPLPVTREQQEARIQLDERRAEQDRRDREASISYGRELDEMNRWPDVPGWDDPKVRADVDGHATADLRSQIETDGDRMIDMGDGRGERPVASVLDELDADADFADVIQLCGRTPF